MKILIVDDSDLMRKLVRRALRQADVGDHTIEEAGDGKQALEKLDTFRPDLVMCDWNMPELSGIDLLRTMRRAGRDTDFFFVTSEGTLEMQTLAHEAGALALISKPFTPESFQSAFRLVAR